MRRHLCGLLAVSIMLRLAPDHYAWNHISPISRIGPIRTTATERVIAPHLRSPYADTLNRRLLLGQTMERA
jgi:hypothetical protein